MVEKGFFEGSEACLTVGDVLSCHHRDGEV